METRCEVTSITPTKSIARNWNTWLAALAAAALAVAVHVGAISVPFLYDDYFYVETNESIRDPGNAARLWLSAYPPGHAEQGLYRPATATTYLVDHAVFGLDAKGFHITNVALHAAATFLFTLVLSLLSRSPPAACIGGLLFAVHAVHTEAVAWIVGRAEVLAGIFCFATTLLWIAYRRGGRLLLEPKHGLEEITVQRGVRARKRIPRAAQRGDRSANG